MRFHRNFKFIRFFNKKHCFKLLSFHRYIFRFFSDIMKKTYSTVSVIIKQKRKKKEKKFKCMYTIRLDIRKREAEEEKKIRKADIEIIISTCR